MVLRIEICFVSYKYRNESFTLNILNTFTCILYVICILLIYLNFPWIHEDSRSNYKMYVRLKLKKETEKRRLLKLLYLLGSTCLLKDPLPEFLKFSAIWILR